MNSKYTQKQIILYCLKFVKLADGSMNKESIKVLDLLIKKYETKL